LYDMQAAAVPKAQSRTFPPSGTTKVAVKVTPEECLKRKALRRPRKTDIEGVDVTCWGRLFQVQAAATGKAWSLTVDSRVRRTFSDSEEADRRLLRALTSAVYSSSSARYDGAVPCRHLYTRTASLNWILSGAFSQCSWRRNGVTWSYLDEENTAKVHDRLELLEKVRWNASQGCVGCLYVRSVWIWIERL